MEKMEPSLVASIQSENETETCKSEQIESKYYPEVF
jgi:hypothetical protein